MCAASQLLSSEDTRGIEPQRRLNARVPIAQSDAARVRVIVAASLPQIAMPLLLVAAASPDSVQSMRPDAQASSNVNHSLTLAWSMLLIAPVILADLRRKVSMMSRVPNYSHHIGSKFQTGSDTGATT